MSTETELGFGRPIDMGKVIRITFLACLTIIVLLIVFDCIFNYLNVVEDRGIRRIFNIAREQSLPTWFSSIQAQLLGVTVLMIAWVQASSVSRPTTAAWLLTGLFFIWIGVDDVAEIHERLGGALERMTAGERTTILREFSMLNPSFSWFFFVAPLYALCGLGIVALVWARFWRLRLTRYLILGCGCWVAAQALDFVEGLDNADALYDWVRESFAAGHRRYMVTHGFKVAEEVLEMLGTTFLWVGFLRYFAHAATGLTLRLELADARKPQAG